MVLADPYPCSRISWIADFAFSSLVSIPKCTNCAPDIAASRIVSRVIAMNITRIKNAYVQKKLALLLRFFAVIRYVRQTA